MQISIAQLVSEIVRGADRSLTLLEIRHKVEMTTALDSPDPDASVRSAIGSSYLIASLGGRPARYTWWPRHVPGSIFRQPLSAADLATGELPLTDELWAAFWPDFYRANHVAPDVVLQLAGGPTIVIRVEHLRPAKPVWGVPETAALADWWRAQAAAAGDDLIIVATDAEQSFEVSLERRGERSEEAIAASNLFLVDQTDQLLRSGRYSLALYSDVVPRLIARDVFRRSPPPDPLTQMLRTDLRFAIWEGNEVYLAERMVDDFEKSMEVEPDPHASPRPQGDWRLAVTPEERRAWGEYLFDRGMDHLWVKWELAAECYYRTALRVDPGHADAWAHLGNLRFDEGRVADALSDYERGEAAALERTIGDPWRYPGTFWDDLDSRPYMRCLHGKGLSLWRLGRPAEAQHVFRQLVELDPDDSQGSGILLRDLHSGLTWEESVARQEAAIRRLNSPDAGE